MAEISITKMSSKGQIVIPSEMRKGFKDKEDFVIIKSDKEIILKSVRDFDENIKDDLKFAKSVREALKRYDKGLFKKMSAEEFLEELDKW